MAAAKPTDTPLYCLDAFSEKASENSFYIEEIQQHLKRHSFVSTPHRHDFYLLLFIADGSGTHTIDFVKYPVAPRSIYSMTPGQVHEWSLSADIQGYILFFQPSFYRMGLTDSSLLEFPFFHSTTHAPLIRLTADQEPFVHSLIHEMQKEFSTAAQANIRILRSYLDLLLLRLAKCYSGHEKVHPLHPQTLRLRKLEALIDKHYVKLRQPRDYAELMNLSASHLNAICKQALGKTLSDLIQERVILEAKRIFAYSDLTINQVARKLNFSEPSYFIRFFRKQTGITPEKFKESLNRPA